MAAKNSRIAASSQLEESGLNFQLSNLRALGLDSFLAGEDQEKFCSEERGEKIIGSDKPAMADAGYRELDLADIRVWTVDDRAVNS